MGNLATATNFSLSKSPLGAIALTGITLLAAGMMKEPLILAFAVKFVLSSSLFGRKRR